MSKSRQGGSYEGRRGHGKGFKRCPVELGEELEVAKNQGFVIFVSDTKLGDRVKIKINRVTDKAANAQVIK
jgi:predicted RNA-binding protein with TRAM domain